ncbi:MAG TPA: Trm112 family protein [Chthoniobacteraceae bacterium]|jgi:uncharacterized protein YbaR (Trm112 family)|nr:Trm112 family protein [Chthoniobacteraceae bacterium]
MIDPELLALLRCPETKQTLRVATAEELAQVNLSAGLIREDGRVIYPIRDGIPVLLLEEAVPMRR